MRMTRPLLSRPNPLDELKRLYDARRAMYETADHVVDTELYNLQRVIEMVTKVAAPSG
jgi:XRE family aerobic/anaerobic benzoate catabolism transcriptional regulator